MDNAVQLVFLFPRLAQKFGSKFILQAEFNLSLLQFRALSFYFEKASDYKNHQFNHNNFLVAF